MSEEKSLWSTCFACIAGAVVLVKGIFRGNKNGTDTWLEMLNVVKDGVFWVFMALFTLIILAAIYFVFKVNFEKIRGVFVAWNKSELWCSKIEKSQEDYNKTIETWNEKYRKLDQQDDHLDDKINQLYEMFVEHKKLTGADVRKVEMDAEREITGNA